MIYGYKQLKSSADWKDIVGEAKWVPTRSAFELAQYWYKGKFPHSVATAFQRSGVKELQELDVACLYIEHPTFLDTFLAPSCKDIMAHCRTRDKLTVVVGVEGKSTETFDKPIRQWISLPTGEPRVTRIRRLEHLSQMLAIPLTVDSSLRYQLVHRTASVVSEAALQGAVAAVVLVHSFAESPENNWRDFQKFLEHLGIEPTQKNIFTSPRCLGPSNVPTYFVWITDKPTNLIADERASSG